MGDSFQGRLFWLYGSKLFLPKRHVSRVQVESVEGGALDDLVVDYSVPLEDSGTNYSREYIQCKFHVSGEKTYSSSALCDPKFFSTKKSFLARAYEAYCRFADDGQAFLLVLASNGDWDSRDKLKSQIATGGALRDKFFTSGPNSDVGKIRGAWCKHLGLDEAEAEPFFRTLRLRHSQLSPLTLLEQIDAHTQLIGLKPIDLAQAHNDYDGVYRSMIENDWLDFDRQTFLELCQREGLGTPREPSLGSVRAAGIRSFTRGSNYMDLECDPFICLCQYFDGRPIRDSASWNDKLSQDLGQWCAALADAPHACEIRLECHCSIAIAAGWMIGPRPQGTILPAQGSKIGGSKSWDPQDGDERLAWASQDVTIADEGDTVAVAISVTHDVSRAATDFLRRHEELSVSVLRMYTLEAGAGHTAIANGGEGWALAAEFAQDIANFVDEHDCAIAHLFTAAPNALNFLLGRMKRPGDIWQTWEHNADGTLPEVYVEAIRIQ